MTDSRLQVVFGPTLLQPPSQDADVGMDAMANMLRDSQPQIRATGFLIRNFAAILFPKDPDSAPAGTQHTVPAVRAQHPGPGATVPEEEPAVKETAPAAIGAGADGGHALPPKQLLIKEWKEEQ